jgi:hypothetical protein
MRCGSATTVAREATARHALRSRWPQHRPRWIACHCSGRWTRAEPSSRRAAQRQLSPLVRGINGAPGAAARQMMVPPVRAGRPADGGHGIGTRPSKFEEVQESAPPPRRSVGPSAAVVDPAGQAGPRPPRGRRSPRGARRGRRAWCRTFGAAGGPTPQEHLVPPLPT